MFSSDAGTTLRTPALNVLPTGKLEARTVNILTPTRKPALAGGVVFLSRPLAVLSLVLFAAMAARAQQRPPASSLPVPPPLPATAAPGLPTQERADVKVVFPNEQIATILDYYQQLTGKHVIADSKVTGTLNLVINDQVTKSEAIKIIEVALSLNGYSLVPGEGDIIKVLGLGSQPRSAGVPIFLDPSSIPDSDQIVAYLARLRYLDPLETVGVLQQFVPVANNVAFTAIPKAGSLIITDNAFHLKQLVALIAQIDLPSAPVVEKFIRLERADATKAVEFLNSAFELKASNTPGAAGTTGGAAGVTANGLRRPIRRVGDDGQPIVDNGAASGFVHRAEQRFRHPGPHHADRRRAHQPRPRRHQPGQHPAHRTTAGRIRRGYAVRHARAPTAALRQRERRAAHPRAGAHRAGYGRLQRHEPHRHYRLEQPAPEHRQQRQQ